MRLDHISYAASHDQLADVVQRIGSRIGSAFIDGGIHPRFGTRNFTLPLNNGHYLEIVCPLDHPAADSSPFGKLVSQRANEGGGWLTWVLSTDDISPIEKRLGRNAVDGHRSRPDGSELRWKQIGVLDALGDFQLPFFIQWLTKAHPSNDGKAIAEISKIVIAGSKSVIEEWTNFSSTKLLENINIEFEKNLGDEGESKILAVHFKTPLGVVIID